jgi:hypothetical protein
MLEEGVSDHPHEGMTVKALPGSALEVIEAEFLFHLLMGLFADPSRLDVGSKRAQVGVGGLVGEVVFFSPDARCPPGRCCWPLSLIRCGGP